MFLFLALAAMPVLGTSCSLADSKLTGDVHKASAATLNRRVDSVLELMTLIEKVGQMNH